MILLGPPDYRDMPWKNGGGTTCELFRLPHPQRVDDFALRLSIAQVSQGGPFSYFPGVDRQLMLLRGAGMQLAFEDGRTARLDQPLQPIAFAGESSVDCALLDGPLQDFNLMVARDWGRAELTVQRLAEGAVLSLPAVSLRLAYLVSGAMAGPAGMQSAEQLLQLRAQACVLTAQQPSVLIVVEAHPGGAL
ncbi:HutD family protein [Chitinimonas sp.]|uniref:HutD/Ves family protein n=1 Tax=Chitinimonas sp. TaxID=1934313 RepID=UPI002F94FD23